jgi:hypothetical protein
MSKIKYFRVTNEKKMTYWDLDRIWVDLRLKWS